MHHLNMLSVADNVFFKLNLGLGQANTETVLLGQKDGYLCNNTTTTVTYSTVKCTDITAFTYYYYEYYYY